MYYNEKLRGLFIQHLRTIYDGKMAIRDELQRIIRIFPASPIKEMLSMKSEVEKNHLEILKTIFHQLNLEIEGGQDNIVRSILYMDDPSPMDPSNKIKGIKFIFSRSLSIYYANAYKVAIDCAAELGNDKITTALMTCLQKNRMEKASLFAQNELMANLHSPAAIAA